MFKKPTPYQARFGNEADTPDASLRGGIIDQQLRRKTVRRFDTNKKIPPEQLDVLLAAATCSPTSGSLQSYSVLVLTTPEEKNKLFTAQRNINIIGGVDSRNLHAINSCSALLIWIADLYRIDTVLKELTNDSELLQQTARAEYHLKAIIDATIAAQSFAMCAESIGLGVMYCGAIRQIEAEHFEKEFDFPKLSLPIFGMAVGYSVENPVNLQRARLPLSSVVHNGSYNQVDSIDNVKQSNTGVIGTIDYVKYADRLVERLKVSDSKKSVSNSLKHMGFKFD